MNGGPIYDQIMNGMMQQMPAQAPPPYANPAPQMTPMQRANAVMQAMRNPMAFAMQQFPDIPKEIAGDPNQILQYLQRTRNISNQQLNNLMSRFPGF